MAQPAGTNHPEVAEPEPQRRGADSDRFFTAALMLVALLPRLYVAIAWAREPVWDGHYYHFGATRIAAGLGYSEDVLINGIATWKPWCHYPVGYSAFLGGLYKVFGTSLLVAPVANAVVGTLCVGVVHRLARFALRPSRSRIAGILAAVHPGLILYTGVVMTEALSGLGIALAGYLALRQPRWRGAVLAGIVVGLSALVRPTALLALPLFMFCFWPRASERLWPKLKLAGVYTALASSIAVLSVMPWTLRNCRVMDGCALISTNGGWNLAIGALTKTGRFTSLSGKDGCVEVTGQVQQDRCWGDVGKAKIAADPLAWLELVPQKLRHTYNHESFAVAYLAEADPAAWPDARKARARETLTVFHHLLMLAAVLSMVSWASPRLLLSQARGDTKRWHSPQLFVGLVVVGYALYAVLQPDMPLFWLVVVAPLVWAMRLPGSPASPPVWGYLWGWVFLTSLTHAVFFGDDRYHLTISPLLCILAAGLFRPAERADRALQTAT